MARTFPGALVPAVNADGSVQWQNWQYDELLQHLTNDLILDNFTPPSSLSWTPTWITAGLINGWVDGLEGVPAFLKDPLGFVWMRGLITTGVTGTTAFVLPPGYRPGASAFYASLQAGGAAGSYIHIDTLGNVAPSYTSGGARLSNTRFLAER